MTRFIVAPSHKCAAVREDARPLLTGYRPERFNSVHLRTLTGAMREG